MKLTDAQMEILKSAQPDGWVEPLGRYRACDALARRGLLSWWTLGHSGWNEETGPTQHRYGPRNDIFRITDLGKSLVAAANQYNRAHGNLAEGDDTSCETMRTGIWVDKTDRQASNELTRASLSTTQRSALEQIGKSASEALPAFYLPKEARLACYGKIRPDNRAGDPTSPRPTRRQHEAMRWMMDHHGRGHSGRNASASEQTFRAMERRGWVRFVREHTWETDWELTDEGRRVSAS